jgi:hypothetical protein
MLSKTFVQAFQDFYVSFPRLLCKLTDATKVLEGSTDACEFRLG